MWFTISHIITYYTEVQAVSSSIKKKSRAKPKSNKALFDGEGHPTKPPSKSKSTKSKPKTPKAKPAVDGEAATAPSKRKRRRPTGYLYHITKNGYTSLL